MAAAGIDERNADGDPNDTGDLEAIPASDAEDDREERDSIEDEDDEEEEDTEPTLKYTKLTGNLASVYRNGDSSSTCLTAGDKLVFGTHSGNLHVLSLPSLQTIKFWHVHSASVTGLSISPFPSTASPTIPAPLVRSNTAASLSSRTAQATPPSSSIKSAVQKLVPTTASNSVFIATASIDGHVCVQSLVDPNDVTLRNYARPVNTVALSPEYKSDRTYLSGGLAGSLILTVGAQTGITTNANTNSAAGGASGWLGSIGLGSNNGKDTILHSGEGTISTIKWSLSGQYVVWVNEHGIKIMRSNLLLENAETENAWKRIGHVERPNRRVWEDMAGTWKARVEWINEDFVDNTDSPPVKTVAGTNGHSHLLPSSPRGSISSAISARPQKSRVEKLLVGWGDTVWMMHITAIKSKGNAGSNAGKVDILHKFVFRDCIVSGLSLYTPSLLLALVYRTHDDDNVPVAVDVDAAPKRGLHRRHNGLPPDLRLIDLDSPEKLELETESIPVSRSETLSASDYHLCIAHLSQQGPTAAAHRSALEALGNIGGGIWDASKNATRLFSSTTSVLSGSSNERPSTNEQAGSLRRSSTFNVPKDAPSSLTKPGLKIFIQSSYDCILAIKRDLSDHLAWLQENEKYEQAWHLIERNPEVVGVTTLPVHIESPSGTPTKSGQSLADFFADETSSQGTSGGGLGHNSNAEKEKRRIGDLWIQQLVTVGKWSVAGSVCAKVLGETSRWEHWIWIFAEANKFDEITPHMPTKPLRPAIPSLAYEVVLGHYLVEDKPKLQELLNTWDNTIFDISSVATAIESKIETGEVRKDSFQDGVRGRDWKILQDCLANLYISDARPVEALKCFMRTKNADGVFELVQEYSLLTAISSDIYDFLTLRIPETTSTTSLSLTELTALTTEPIDLLIDGATQGVILPETVISQIEPRGPPDSPLLFLYFRALWFGLSTADTDDNVSTSPTQTANHPLTRSRFDHRHLAHTSTTTRALLAPHADLAVDLFAAHSRPLLSALLKSTTAYDLAHATAVCESRNYIPELVHLLATTGQTKRALRLLLDQLQDVVQAIAFAREQDDAGLWDDLLAHSRDKPDFLRALLEQAGVGIDAAKLVKSIPEGLEIQGLKPGLVKILRDAEIQASISEGAARVLRSEVVASLEALRRRRTRGVPFGSDTRAVHGHGHGQGHAGASTPATKINKCAICASRVDRPPPAATAIDDEEDAAESQAQAQAQPIVDTDHLLAFTCGHLAHLTCVLSALDDTSPAATAAIDAMRLRLADDVGSEERDGGALARRRVGTRVAQAQMVAGALDKYGGGGGGSCPVCREKKITDD